MKNFDGSPKVIEESIKTLADLQKQFPKVATGNKKLTLALSYNMDDEDFAITKGRIITLNANAFRDIEKLQTEYKKLVDEGWFVKGTDYRAIIYHEFGHVVAKIYNLNPMKIACAITGLEQLQTMQFIQENISEYAGSVPKGTEIISEVFSDMSTETPNEFSQKFYSELKEL